MLFNSLAFLLFFPLVFIIYWAIPTKKVKLQNLVLLLASYVFYGWWDWRFLSLIAFSTLVDFFIGLAISKHEGRKRHFFLMISVFTNLGLLGVFKYFNFFIESFLAIGESIGYTPGFTTLNIILPVGISFYTFQTMSYSIDIYRKEISPTKNFIAFASFVALFPQLVAGPIERASNLVPQLLNQRYWSHNKFKDGFFQILVGFFRKVVVADSIGSLIDGIYNAPDIHNATSIVMAVVLYSFQIYFDFSGYSDIAIGTAKLLGFEFKPNFNLPYFSSSITEFWRRWHISLSSWLRDYLYIPLGGNRKGLVKQYRNLFITMFLGGLWHGSSWNFVVWGSLHGILLAVEKRFNLIPNKYRFFNNILVFAIVTFIWIFFRSLSFHDTEIIISKLFSFDYGKPFIGNISIFATVVYGLLVALIFDTFLFIKNIRLESYGSSLKVWWYVPITCFIIINTILFYSDANNFIYFQF